MTNFVMQVFELILKADTSFLSTSNANVTRSKWGSKFPKLTMSSFAIQAQAQKWLSFVDVSFLIRVGYPNKSKNSRILMILR